ncbi:MAG TPA: VanZ family protein [Solirubrobacterales bacterium]|nr:VanZ family protein [Solirubrobacterales bacterium]
MALIFWLSAQPDLDSGLGLADDILRKLLHVVIYAALTLLWFWTLRPLLPGTSALALAGLIALIYGITDEYHQTFVEGRDGRPLDVGIDLIGIVLASLLLRYDQRFRSVLDGEET